MAVYTTLLIGRPTERAHNTRSAHLTQPEATDTVFQDSLVRDSLGCR